MQLGNKIYSLHLMHFIILITIPKLSVCLCNWQKKSLTAFDASHHPQDHFQSSVCLCNWQKKSLTAFDASHHPEHQFQSSLCLSLQLGNKVLTAFDASHHPQHHSRSSLFFCLCNWEKNTDWIFLHSSISGFCTSSCSEVVSFFCE